MLCRREFLRLISSATSLAAVGWTADSFAETTPQLTIDEWKDKAFESANHPVSGVSGPLRFGRFKDRIYFLMEPIEWFPDPKLPEQKGYSKVVVPKGFVTDLASIPRIFYSLLPPDGPYTYPAVIHDFLYWNQGGTKKQADHVLKFGMEYFKVGTITTGAIYDAVVIGGQSSWDGNAHLKAQGEKRILTKFPDDPTITWEQWKSHPANFA